MKSAQHSSVVRSGSRSGFYHGRHTIERIYRRIAASNVVDTLRRGRSRRTGQKSSSWTLGEPSLQHPQSQVLEKRSRYLWQQRQERTKSRRKAREKRLQRVWEKEEMSSCSEVSEVTPADIGLEYSTEESTDTSTVELAISRARDSRGQKHNKSCLPHGYVPQLLCSIVLSLGNLNIGFCLAYHALSPANILAVASGQPAWVLPWAQNLFNLGGLIGGLLSSLALNRGRKRPLVFFILILTASWLMVILAHNSSMIFGARLMAGVAAGVIYSINQVYIAELVKPQSRGSLGVLPTVFGLIGTLLCFGLSSFVPLSHLAITGASINGPYLVLLILCVPDSPRYYLKIDKAHAAANSLSRLGIEAEHLIPTIQGAQELFKLADYHVLRKPFLMPVVLAGGIMFFSQFAGIDGILMYAFDRFRTTQPGSWTNLPVVVLYSVQLLTAIICFSTIDRTGRKTLLLVSTTAAALSSLALGLYVLLFDDLAWPAPENDLRWIPITCLIAYSGAFALGLGTIPWLMLGELLPARNRGTAIALASTCYWGPSLIISNSFGDMKNAMYLSGTIWFYTIFCLFAYLFVLLVLPDIRPHATLEQIQLFFLAKSTEDQEHLNHQLHKEMHKRDAWNLLV